MSEEIKANEIIATIRLYANEGRTGRFSCLNPHWWVYLYPYKYCFEYADNPDVQDEYCDYEEYSDIENLIEDHYTTLVGIDDWIWSGEDSDE